MSLLADAVRDNNERDIRAEFRGEWPLPIWSVGDSWYLRRGLFSDDIARRINDARLADENVRGRRA